jgi:hypothetical protein
MYSVGESKQHFSIQRLNWCYLCTRRAAIGLYTAAFLVHELPINDGFYLSIVSEQHCLLPTLMYYLASLSINIQRFTELMGIDFVPKLLKKFTISMYPVEHKKSHSRQILMWHENI